MPKYWNSSYFNKDTNELSDKAPQRLKNEFKKTENTENETEKDGLIIVEKF